MNEFKYEPTGIKDKHNNEFFVGCVGLYQGKHFFEVIKSFEEDYRACFLETSISLNDVVKEHTTSFGGYINENGEFVIPQITPKITALSTQDSFIEAAKVWERAITACTSNSQLNDIISEYNDKFVNVYLPTTDDEKITIAEKLNTLITDKATELKTSIPTMCDMDNEALRDYEQCRMDEATERLNDYFENNL